MKKPALVLATTALAALSVPAGAPAQERQQRTCADTATVQPGRVFLAVGAEARAQRRLVRTPEYFTTRTASFRFGGVRYTASRETTFSLECSRRRAVVRLVEGTVTLTAGRRRPALVATVEGTVEAGRTRGQAVRVTRIANLIGLGTTTIRRTGGSGRLGITPLVGSRPGTARQATGATLEATGRDEDRDLEGTARFVGLAR